ncbi:type IV toxin-antitoxin system AbiEi family antitoxin [Virgisporangium aurantiacum]|uniref:AbiEi antitoxin C-terminal domain-containing protein n=1 Tax=Virgisporangium aurantiacum TaxID=175570 RepID=A0A8J3Z0D4_9ACTN|nr:type IV toxin-antitoxin system AbiEi family antitoxin [Virgisporangium aurantiacum]GIJ53010.1 hypothetical protein Vau01_005260 [Virgisporangium aurantiacum]
MTGKLYLYRDIVTANVSRERLRTAVDKDVVTRLSRGVYTSGDQRPSRLRALFVRLPEGIVLGHESAARVYGFGGPGPIDDPVHVIVPAGTVRPRIRGVACHEAVLPVAAPILIDGIPCAPPARCAVDLARHATRFGGIAVLDAALRSGTCTADDLADEVLLHDGLRGVCRVRELVRLADGRAECAQESHLRLLIIDAGLQAPEPQVWVHDSSGRPVYRIDLAYRERRVGLEYDGRSHLTPDRLTADRSRMNWLGNRGWTMRHFTARDLYQHPAITAAEVRAALE